MLQTLARRYLPGRRVRQWAAAELIGLLLISSVASAQFSDSYNFLKAVRDQDGNKVTEMLGKSGSTLINTRDVTTQESALHIVVKRRDLSWLQFLLVKGARPDIRDKAGDTPLIIASRIGFVDAVPLLVAGKANVNAPNDRGETPLIIAVQNRDAATVRQLVALGADPKLKDSVVGMSARDYAVRDGRSAALLKILDQAKPAAPSKPVSGPKL